MTPDLPRDLVAAQRARGASRARPGPPRIARGTVLEKPPGVAMDLVLAHTLPRPLEAVEAALLDPAFAPALAAACPALAEGRVLDYEVRGDLVERAAWFRAAPAWLGGAFARLATVAWVERVRWSREAHAGRFEVTPDVPSAMARRVRCAGGYALAAGDAGSTARTVSISLTVRAPLVGAAAEARLAELLRAVFASEAALLGGRP